MKTDAGKPGHVSTFAQAVATFVLTMVTILKFFK